MTELGHIVFYVKNLQTSLRFYTEAVGLQLQGTIFGARGALLSGGRTHHELLLIQVGEAPGPLIGKRIGLYHAGWKVGDHLNTLSEVYQRVTKAGYTIEAMSDHTVSQSIYLKDPDGNEVELYVDNPEIDWRRDKRWMDQPVKPLNLRACRIMDESTAEVGERSNPPPIFVA